MTTVEAGTVSRPDSLDVAFSTNGLSPITIIRIGMTPHP